MFVGCIGTNRKLGFVSRTMNTEGWVEHTDNTPQSTAGEILWGVRLNLAKGQALFVCCHPKSNNWIR